LAANAANTQTQADPKKAVAPKLAIMRAEVLLVAVFVLLGMGAWLAADRFAAKLLSSWEPSREAEKLKREVPRKSDGLAMTLKEQEATEEQLIQARLEYFGQSALVSALPTPTPAPTPADARRRAPSRRTNAPAAQPSPMPETASQKREEATTQRDAAGLRVNALIERLKLLQDNANELRAEVEDGGRAASAKYDWQHFWYRIERASLTLAGVIVLLLLVAGGMYPLFRGYEKKARAAGRETNSRLVVQLIAGLLVVLIAYQTFELAGAAFFGALVLLLFLWRMPWEPPEKRAEADGGQ
jgi:hypothetical protein